jgi:hypothetical protein
MQKWEYLFLAAEKTKGGWVKRLANGDELEDWDPDQFEEKREAGSVWLPRFVNDEELKGWEKGPSLYEYANQLGEENWELVNLTWQGKEHLSLVFKKPMSDKSHDQQITLNTIAEDFGVEIDESVIDESEIDNRGISRLSRELRAIDIKDEE